MNSKLFFVGIFFILFSQIAFAESVAVEREMPSKIKAGNIFEVTIKATVDPQNAPSGYVVTEYYPAGFEIINGGDTVNPTERKITWLVYGKPAGNIEVEYALKANEVKAASFSGNVLDNLEYKVSEITGDVKIEVTANEQDCLSLWSCTVWSACLNSEQTRVCTDLNNCANQLNKPAETLSCSSESSSSSGSGSSGGGGGPAGKGKVNDTNVIQPASEPADQPKPKALDEQASPEPEDNGVTAETTTATGKVTAPLKYLFVLLTKWVSALFAFINFNSSILHLFNRTSFHTNYI